MMNNIMLNEIEQLIMEKIKVSLSAINQLSSTQSDADAARTVYSLSDALSIIHVLKETETKE